MKGWLRWPGELAMTLDPGQSVYISGPMTGMPDNNKELFARAAKHLRDRGLVVISPAEQPDEVLDGDGWSSDDDEYEGFLARDKGLVEQVDAIVFLKGWERSGGAGREGRWAIEAGHPLYILMEDPYERPGHGFYPLLRIDPRYFERHSTTERLRKQEAT